MLIYTKEVYENNKKLLTDQTVEQEKQLLERIGKLPQDIRKYIGSFSNVVINQKKLVRIEFYNNWFTENKTRITQLLSSWSKTKLFVRLVIVIVVIIRTMFIFPTNDSNRNCLTT